MGGICKFWLLTGCFLLSVNICVADTRLYKIEMIVFAQNASNSEQFEQTEQQIDWPSGFKDLSEFKAGNKSLGGTYRKLKQHADYQPLLHVSWIQGLRSNTMGKAVRISKEDKYTENDMLAGFVRVQRGYLLYLILDMEYMPEATVYRINEKRRFKLNEVHYFDHPEFGVIIKVKPLSD